METLIVTVDRFNLKGTYKRTDEVKMNTSLLKRDNVSADIARRQLISRNVRHEYWLSVVRVSEHVKQPMVVLPKIISE